MGKGQRGSGSGYKRATRGMSREMETSHILTSMCISILVMLLYHKFARFPTTGKWVKESLLTISYNGIRTYNFLKIRGLILAQHLFHILMKTPGCFSEPHLPICSPHGSDSVIQPWAPWVDV